MQLHCLLESPEVIVKGCEAFVASIVATREQLVPTTSNILIVDDTIFMIPTEAVELSTTIRLRSKSRCYLVATNKLPRLLTKCHHLSSRNSRTNYERCVNGVSSRPMTRPRMSQSYLYETKMEVSGCSRL